MVILLLLNQSPRWTIKEIYNETKIEIDLLKRILKNLLESKLLICTQANDKDLKETNLKMNFIIQINEEFQQYIVFV